MDYSDDDCARLYGQIEPKPRALTLREFVLLALAAVLAGFLLGCDASDAATTAAIVEEAKAKTPVLSYPCAASMRLETLSGRVVHHGCYNPRSAP